MKFRMRPFFVFEVDGTMHRFDENGEFETNDKKLIAALKDLGAEAEKTKKREVKEDG